MWRSEDHQVYSIRLYFAESFFQTCYRKKFFIQRVASEIAKENAGNEGGIMKITYINHSGFLIETRDCYYIFDYYKGELPHLDKEKEVIVFCSHFHEDHFNPQIFGILEDMGLSLIHISEPTRH